MSAAPAAHGLEQILIWLCVCAAAIVFAWMLYSVAAFRHRTQAHPTAEILWALIPIMIVVLSAAPALRQVLPKPGSHGDIAVTAEESVSRQGETSAPDMAKKAFNERAVPL